MTTTIETPAPTDTHAEPGSAPSVRVTIPQGPNHSDTHAAGALGSNFPAFQCACDAHSSHDGGELTSDRDQVTCDTPGRPVAIGAHSPVDQSPLDLQEDRVGGGTNSGTCAEQLPTPDCVARPSLFDPALYMLAAQLDDIEGIRKAQANRRRILTATEPDEDGVMRGFGLTETHPTVAVIDALASQLDDLEHRTILALNRAMRAHPLAPWQKQAKGVGEKQLARLLAAIGDPYLRTMPDGTTHPRTVSALWAYSGLHTLPAGAQDGTTTQPTSPLPGSTIAAKRRKGEKANWSTDAKTRAYLIATSCIKQDGDYRAVYDERRSHTAETHPDWTPGHSHNDALRIVSKRILRDLWRAARDYYEGDPK